MKSLASPHNRKNLIERMTEFDRAIGQLPGARFGDDACPLTHTFGDGVYIRQITMPANTVVVSEIHTTNHPYFVIKGKVSVLTEDGTVCIKAPYWGMTKAGTKRVLRIHEETVWITVHATEETDPVKIREQITVKNYNALPDNLKNEIEGEVL